MKTSVESSGDSQGNLFPLLVLVFSISACAHTATTSTRSDWRTANIHKIAVVCVQDGDSKANRQIESDAVPNFRRQGFDAIGVQELFPAASQYSPKYLMGRLRQAHVDGVMEIAYSGEAPPDGLPRQFKFKYHSIKGWPEQISNRRRTLDAALIALMGPGKGEH
jgi:hypothetical protein